MKCTFFHLFKYPYICHRSGLQARKRGQRKEKVLPPMKSELSTNLIPANNYGASQLCYQHPWGAKAHASSILFLPRLVGNLFEDDGVAHAHDFMDQAAMQALAMGCELAFFGGL